MKEKSLIEMQNKIASLTKVMQQLINDFVKLDSLSRGTITALQLFIGEDEWKKIVEKMKKIDEEEKSKANEKKLDLDGLE
jgi:ATP sulfurylase|tara:strand:- start:389 stop:628 length:240 start_codon:yes stop_codon:yes gene_type:complete